MLLLLLDKARREAERQVKTKSRERLLTESWSYREPCTEEQLGKLQLCCEKEFFTGGHENIKCGINASIETKRVSIKCS